MKQFKHVQFLVMIHKILTGVTNVKVKNFFNFITSTTRGDMNKITFSKAVTSKRQHLFVSRAGTQYLNVSKKHCIPVKVEQFRKLAKRFIKPSNVSDSV
ncbi:hypothetical protein Y032_0067g110 [Ancylostoma ceylanicum]|uniref:Uncharacterized protein n=1 Tax=Ancylostoma ceylanicum TaxID=53326 RepID=A0A016TZU2_9BILA|nr:hypothetical protein Y032_0067g110 [Ancylostoma ceylanicum]